MNTCNIYILDTTYSEFGEKYNHILEEHLDRINQERTWKIIIDNPAFKTASDEELSAQNIINCDYFIVLYKTRLSNQDQILFAKSKGKKVYEIDVEYYDSHRALCSWNELEDYIKKLSSCNYHVHQQPIAYDAAVPGPGCGCILVLGTILTTFLGIFCVRRLIEIIQNGLGSINGSGGGATFKICDIILLPISLVFSFILTIGLIYCFKKGLDCIIHLILMLISRLKESPAPKEDNSANSYNVFVSYAHDNTPFDVIEFVDYLKQSQHNPWYDGYMEETPGADYNEIIAANILECNNFIPLINQAYVDSDFCRDEFYFARSKSKDIFPVLFGTVRLTPGMEMRLMQQIQCINASDYLHRRDLFQHIATAIHPN